MCIRDSPYRFARLTELINEDLPIDVSKAASIPVSYTHLDVYKRQGTHQRVCLRLTVSDLSARAAKTPEEMERLLAVSYTHLL